MALHLKHANNRSISDFIFASVSVHEFIKIVCKVIGLFFLGHIVATGSGLALSSHSSCQILVPFQSLIAPFLNPRLPHLQHLVQCRLMKFCSG